MLPSQSGVAPTASCVAPWSRAVASDETARQNSSAASAAAAAAAKVAAAASRASWAAKVAARAAKAAARATRAAAAARVVAAKVAARVVAARVVAAAAARAYVACLGHLPAWLATAVARTTGRIMVARRFPASRSSEAATSGSTRSAARDAIRTAPSCGRPRSHASRPPLSVISTIVPPARPSSLGTGLGQWRCRVEGGCRLGGTEVPPHPGFAPCPCRNGA